MIHQRNVFLFAMHALAAGESFLFLGYQLHIFCSRPSSLPLSCTSSYISPINYSAKTIGAYNADTYGDYRLNWVKSGILSVPSILRLPISIHFSNKLHRQSQMEIANQDYWICNSFCIDTWSNIFCLMQFFVLL